MFILSKLIGFLLNPLIWIGFGLLLAMLLPQKRTLSIKIATSLFLVFSNPLLSNYCMSLLEADRVEINADNKFRVGVLLTGMTSGRIDQPGIHFESGADRFTQAVALLKTNAIDKIIISGGSGLIDDQEYSESPLLSDLAKIYGIADTAIIVESASRNTYENALFTKPILEQLGTDSCLVITSAFHMKRSLACFQQLEIRAKGFPTDFRANRVDFSIYSFVPSIGALSSWDTILHEWFGIIYYRMAGYT